MQHGMSGTPPTLTQPTTRFAGQDGGITAAVDEHKHLLAQSKVLFHCRYQVRRETLFKRKAASVDKLNFGQGNCACALRELHTLIPASLTMVPRLEGRRRGPEHHGYTQIMPAPDGEVTSGISQAILLLV